jgi:hypothetical protein
MLLQIAYIWDDHDYGENNAGAESLSRLSALQAYPMNVPHYPLPNYASGKGNIGQVRREKVLYSQFLRPSRWAR